MRQRILVEWAGRKGKSERVGERWWLLVSHTLALSCVDSQNKAGKVIVGQLRRAWRRVWMSKKENMKKIY